MNEAKNKFYVATAIPYVNGKLHIGHAIDQLNADVLARYHRLKGDDVFYSAGADEHGAKIFEAAEEAGKTPQKFVDELTGSFRENLSKFNITNDRFIRTTDKDHQSRVAHIWKQLEKDIYKNKYVGMYCVGCEEFKSAAYVKETLGTCPNHKRVYEKVEEENYFFRLTAYNDRIKTAIETGAYEVIPKPYRKEILNVIEDGLDDISISRKADKVSWGIPVPGDETQVIYVWFEALLNYITVIGYPEHPDFEKFWPADVQIIGKDILRFHAATWPGILLALGLPLPSRLFVHGFVSNNGQKLSKSLGNIVDPVQLVNEYGIDAVRYYFLRHGPNNGDSDYSKEKFELAYNSELANELGNAVSRVAAMATKYQNGDIGTVPPAEHDIGRYHQAIADCRFDRALEEVWGQIRGINLYIEQEKPWLIAKEDNKEHLQEVLAYLCSSLLEVADLLIPFMPDTAQKITEIFASGKIVRSEAPLFPRIDIKEPKSD